MYYNNIVKKIVKTYIVGRKRDNIAELIILGIFIVIYLISKANLNHKVNNYDISKVSTGKMAMDAGKSYTEIQRNMVAGKYDKDDKWKI